MLYQSRTDLVRDDVTWVSDSVIEYTPKRLYTYDFGKSRPRRQTDKITTVNIPAVV